MDITTEELDKKVADAVADAESAKNSELQTKIEETKKEADERVEKMRLDSTRKVGEHDKELGELRKVKTEAEETIKEVKTLRSELSVFKEKETEAETKAKEVALKKAKDPVETLKTMSDEEVKMMDTYLDSETCPDEVKKAVANADTNAETLAEVLSYLREESAAPITSPASSWLQSQKESSVNDSKSIRDIIKDSLIENNKSKNPRATMPKGGVAMGAVTKSEPVKSLGNWTGNIRDSIGVKK